MKYGRKSTLQRQSTVGQPKATGARTDRQLEDTRDAMKIVEDGISDKLHTKKEVIHYDSPAKDRLRQVEQGIIDEYRNSRLLDNKEALAISQQESGSSRGRGSKTVVQRLHELEREKQIRLERIRQNKIVEELSHMRDKPEINNYELSKERSPLHMQSERPKDFDEEMKKYRNQNAKQSRDENLGDTVQSSGSKNTPLRSTEDLFAWKDKRSLQLANKRLTQGQEDMTFSPRLNQRSIDMVREIDFRSKTDLVTVSTGFMHTKQPKRRNLKL